MQKNWHSKKQTFNNSQNTNETEDAQDRKKKRQRQASRSRHENKQELFLPPDEDNYDDHGIKNLVIKYPEFGSVLDLDK